MSARNPPYVRIVADLRARIAMGQLGAGDRLPSTRQITREWGVAMATATKALAVLRQEGLVEAVRGVGTVVRATASSESGGHGVTRQPRKEPHREGRRTAETTLTREAIVEAAITVADVEGIEAMSMRRVSTVLHVSTMALYRHITSKQELVTAMIEKVHQDAALPEPPPADWRQALRLGMLREWNIFRRHPWTVKLTPVAGPVMTPGTLTYSEWMLRVITAQGHSSDAAVRFLTILSAYTSGMAMQATRAEVEENEDGMDAENWWKSKAPELVRFADQGEFPIVFGASGPPDVNGFFTFGMDALLDGLAPLIAGGDDSKGRLSGPI